MNKLTFNFLLLLGLATLALGALWSSLSPVLFGQAVALNVVVILFSSLVLVISLGLLARIILYTTQQQKTALSVRYKENGDE